MSSGLVVEFIGLPGAGKTTLALEVLRLLAQETPVQLAYSRLRDKGWPLRRVYSTRDILALSFFRPRYALRAGRAIQTSGQRSLYDYLKVTNNWLSVSAAVAAARHAPGVTLFDQGMFQALWSVGYSARGAARPGLLQRLSAAMPKPDLLILVSAEPATILRRLRGRGGQASRLDVARADTAGQLPEAAALLTEVVALARAQAGLALLELPNDTDGDLSGNARTAAEAICTALGLAGRL